MKKLLGFASLLLIALLTACNADNLDEIVEAGKGDVLSEADRVPVQLSISPASNSTELTRAPLVSGTTPNHNFTTPDGQYLGIFALAQTNTPAGNITGPVSTENIRWDGSVERARLLWNQPAKADSTNQWQGQVLQDYYTAIHLLDPASLSTTPTEVFPSYPLSSWYNYYFYAYYPRVADNSIHESNNVVTADYTLDGSQDIITGIAKPATNPNNGYCGKYFRSIRVSGDGSLQLGQIPQLELNHHLAQLRFFVRSKLPAVGTFQMKEITMLDVPTQWSLTIADKSDDNNRGTLTSRSTTTANILVREIAVDGSNNMTSATDDPVYDGTTYTTLTTTPKVAGYAMVPTTAMITTANSTQNREFATSYEVQLTIRSNDEVAELTRTITTPDDGFLPGKVYNVIINVDQNSIEDLEIDPREVDMGFPSKTKWACMNIGASSETDLGETNKELFAWGATEGHQYKNSSYISDGYVFTWANAPFYDGQSGDDYYWTKYPPGSVLAAEDDYASLSWGGKWRMPTSAEIQELINNTTKVWETKNGVVGMTFTSTRNGNSIFLPACGYRWHDTRYDNRYPGRDYFYQRNNQGYYWSGTLSTSDNKQAMCLKFTNENTATCPPINRCYGMLIRAVKK
jgi:hypothetical protein